ncbi:MAG: hypothetical protein SYR96_03795 [Actinomycetota bacterium]|nr:hypothetical protein [Actinomycetota bacterium]
MNARNPVAGLCLTGTSAVIAVVRPGPAQLIAVAELVAPGPSWMDADTGEAVRMLSRARRRLRLPRRCVVNMVCLAAPGDPAGLALVARCAGILARGGFVPVSRGTGPSAGIGIEPEVAAAITAEEHRQAVRAAAALLDNRPAPAHKPAPASTPAESPASKPPALRPAESSGPRRPTEPARARVAVPTATGSWNYRHLAMGDRSVAAPEPPEWTGVEPSGTGWVVQPLTHVEPNPTPTAKTR